MASERRTLMKIHELETSKVYPDLSKKYISKKKPKSNKNRSFGNFLYYSVVSIAVVTLITVIVYAFQHNLIKLG